MLGSERRVVAWSTNMDHSGLASPSAARKIKVYQVFTGISRCRRESGILAGTVAQEVNAKAGSQARQVLRPTNRIRNILGNWPAPVRHREWHDRRAVTNLAAAELARNFSPIPATIEAVRRSHGPQGRLIPVCTKPTSPHRTKAKSPRSVRSVNHRIRCVLRRLRLIGVLPIAVLRIGRIARQFVVNCVHQNQAHVECQQ
jgi:hypothetical protein